MRQFLKEIQAPFTRFIRSRSSFMMLLQCDPEDSVLPLKSLENLENDPEDMDIFLRFGHPFESPHSYIEQVLALLRLQIEQVNQELTKRGDPPLPSMDAPAGRTSTKWSEALMGAVHHIRGIVPRQRRLVWLFVPLEIRDAEGYLDFARRLAGEEGAGELGIRFVLRDDLAKPHLVPWMAGEPGVDVHRPRLDPDSVEEKLESLANDPRVPKDEQAQMHMMLAGMDVSKGRHDQALARNLELLGYFRHTGRKHQESMVLNNLGDLHYLRGRHEEAVQWYERAVGLSVKLGSAPMVLCQSMNLGHALFAQGKFAESLLYYQSAEQLAQATSSPIHQIQALERVGSAQRETRSTAEAVQTWERAVQLSRQYHHEAGARSNLENLKRLFAEMGDVERRRHYARQLSELDAGID